MLVIIIILLAIIMVRQLQRGRREKKTTVMENDLYGMFEEDNTALTDYNVYYQQQTQDKEEEGK